MTLVKLDSGDYINTNYVTRLGHRHGNLKCDPEQSETLSLSNRDDDEWISITPADKARIVEAMNESNEAKPDFTRLTMAYVKLDAINDEQRRNHSQLDFSPALEFLRKAINGDPA